MSTERCASWNSAYRPARRPNSRSSARSTSPTSSSANGKSARGTTPNCANERKIGSAFSAIAYARNESILSDENPVTRRTIDRTTTTKLETAPCHARDVPDHFEPQLEGREFENPA